MMDGNLFTIFDLVDDSEKHSFIPTYITLNEDWKNELYEGYYPLHYVCRKSFGKNPNCLDIIELFLDNGVDLEIRGTFNWTALHYACENHPDIVQLLIDKGPNVHAISNANNRPIHIACRRLTWNSNIIESNQLKIIEILLENGADVNEIGGGGKKSAYDMAPLKVKTFLDERIQPTSIFELMDDPEKHSLIQAYMESHENWKDEVNENKHNPIHHACKHVPELVELLVDNGADVNRKSNSLNQWYPLHFASKYQPTFVDLLIEKGADLTATSTRSSTPLHIACSSDNLESVKSLIEAGANVHARDNQGFTPRGRAHVEMILDYIDSIADSGLKEEKLKCLQSLKGLSLNFNEEIQRLEQLMGQ